MLNRTPRLIGDRHVWHPAPISSSVAATYLASGAPRATPRTSLVRPFRSTYGGLDGLDLGVGVLFVGVGEAGEAVFEESLFRSWLG
jgi:hypothetical protein